MPLGLLIPLLTPILTEIVQWLFKKTIAAVPPATIPVISTLLGTATAAVAQANGMPLGIGGDPLAVGAELGLAGTGIHQFQKLLIEWMHKKGVKGK